MRQTDIADIQVRRSRLAVMTAELAQQGALLASAEAQVIALLRAGAEVEAGPMTACIETKKGQCRPAWKNLFLGHMEEKHGVPVAAAEQEARKDYPPVDREVLAIGVRMGHS